MYAVTLSASTPEVGNTVCLCSTLAMAEQTIASLPEHVVETFSFFVDDPLVMVHMITCDSKNMDAVCVISEPLSQRWSPDSASKSVTYYQIPGPDCPVYHIVSKDGIFSFANVIYITDGSSGLDKIQQVATETGYPVRKVVINSLIHGHYQSSRLNADETADENAELLLSLILLMVR